MIAQRFGRYQIEKRLPGGGMGRVYLATDSGTDERIALKLIEHAPDPDSEEVVAAEREGAMLQVQLAELDPRVTRVWEYGDTGDYFYIAMEYIEGEDLAEVLARHRIGHPFAVRIAIDILEVLQKAHTLRTTIDGHDHHGVVHGDIKPRNVRVMPDGQVRLLDFGISKALSATRKFTRNVFGSVQYSSPERLNAGVVDVPADLWSIGVMLFEMLTGKPYFGAENAARLETLIRSYTQLQAIPPDLPPGLRSILAKALAPDPLRRYLTAQAFRDDLRAFQEGMAPNAEIGDAEDATRRTSPAATVEEERTRRTARPAAAASPAPVPAAVEAGAPRAKRRDPRWQMFKMFVAGFLFMIAGYFVYSEYQVWKRGAALAHDLQTEHLTDLNQAWQRYQALAQSVYIPSLLASPRRALKDRLTAAADAAIKEYRDNDTPNVREGDWDRARQALLRAVELDPEDRTVRGRVRLAEGHLYRIRGRYNEARAKFQEAGELMPRSPDPQLGLARLYVYGYKDVERAADALQEAEKRGFDPGKREKAQLADGYFSRGDQLVREADKARGTDQEKEYLQRAKKDYKRAEELYRDILPFGSVTASLRKLDERRTIVDDRLDELGGSWLPWR